VKKIIFVSTGIILMVFILGFQNEALAFALKRLFCEVTNTIEKGATTVYQEIKSFVIVLESF
jgi:hypothetical protein